MLLQALLSVLLRTQALNLIIALVWFATASFGQERGNGPSDEVRESGGGINGIIWKTSPKFPRESHNPTPAEQKRLRVKWDNPRVGDVPNRGNDFKETAVSSSLTCVAISGTLAIESEDGKSVKPVDWCQGVRILMERKPGSEPDWKSGIGQRWGLRSTLERDCVIDKDGKFTGYFAADAIERSVGRAVDLQVGLCLGTKSGKTITWRDSTPPLPQSIAKLSVTGPRPLSESIRIINGAPAPDDHDFDPAKLVKAVNHLHSLGKDKAIAEMRAFLKMSGQAFHARRDAANIDTADNRSLFLIIPLLFEAKDISGKELEKGVMILNSESLEKETSLPRFTLVTVDDLPFLIEWVSGLSGPPPVADSFLDWVERNGTLRSHPLRPSDNPLTAADKYSALPKVKRPTAVGAEGQVRNQAWRAISSLVKSYDLTGYTRLVEDFKTEGNWNKAKDIAAKLKIRWSEKQQKYVVE